MLTMRKVFYVLIFIVGTFAVYNLSNPPRSAMRLIVPVHTLEKLGINAQDINARQFFMLSAEDSCVHEFSEQNYTVMFNQNVGNWRDIKVWTQHVTLYFTWKDIWKIKEQIFLCINSQNRWEPAWKGKFSLTGVFNIYVAHMDFFCDKKDKTSKWECNGYELAHNKNKEEIYKLLTKYNKNAALDNSFTPDGANNAPPD